MAENSPNVEHTMGKGAIGHLHTSIQNRLENKRQRMDLRMVVGYGLNYKPPLLSSTRRLSR